MEVLAKQLRTLTFINIIISQVKMILDLRRLRLAVGQYRRKRRKVSGSHSRRSRGLETGCPAGSSCPAVTRGQALCLPSLRSALRYATVTNSQSPFVPAACHHRGRAVSMDHERSGASHMLTNCGSKATSAKVE